MGQSDSTINVLVVETDAAYRLVVELYIKAIGLEPTAVGSAAEAIELFDAWAYAVFARLLAP